MSYRYSVVFVLSTALLAALLTALDALDFLIYFFFLPPLCASGAWICGVAAYRSRGRSRFDLLVTFSCLLALTMYSFALRFIPTSPRKHFLIRATSIRGGASVSAVRATLADCRAQDNPDSISFFFWAGPGTQDVVVVRVTPDRQRVVSAEYSPD